MNTTNTPVSVTILDKEYRIACRENEQEALIHSARYLDAKMKELRNNGKVVGLDRIAVMVALNLAHELLQYKSQRAGVNESLSTQIQFLQNKIDFALNKDKQMEL